MLKIEKLTVTYPKAKKPALKNITLNVEKGEFIAVLGLSGAGKSTLIRCMNRLVEPTGGIMEWEGKNVRLLKGVKLRQYRRSIGMIFQSFNLIDRLSTLKNVLVGRLGYTSIARASFFHFHVDEKKEALKALNRVGLSEFANRRVSQLSGGQRQRVAIARSLVQKPKLILGDEPVASLDPKTAHSVMGLLAEINQEDKITMMINLHDVELAKTYASRIIGISGGEIVFDGPPEQLTEEDLTLIYSSGAAKNES